MTSVFTSWILSVLIFLSSYLTSLVSRICRTSTPRLSRVGFLDNQTTEVLWCPRSTDRLDMSSLPAPNGYVSLYLHAELLPNIRQITLYISLPQSSALDGVRPEIQLSESRKAVTLTLTEPYSHVTETIKLPARVSDASRRTLKTNAAPITTSLSRDYSFRMQIDADDDALTPRDDPVDSYVPWTAADMSPSTRIRCRACGIPFLKASSSDKTSEKDANDTTGWIWKDLPSGNWAEMMDFWHCHKPDPHEDDPEAEASAALRIEEANAQVKGYGASSRVEATPGVVLIDVATFLIAESDCVGLKKVSSFVFFPRFSFSPTSFSFSSPTLTLLPSSFLLHHYQPTFFSFTPPSFLDLLSSSSISPHPSLLLISLPCFFLLPSSHSFSPPLLLLFSPLSSHHFHLLSLLPFSSFSPSHPSPLLTLFSFSSYSPSHPILLTPLSGNLEGDHFFSMGWPSILLPKSNARVARVWKLSVIPSPWFGGSYPLLGSAPGRWISLAC